MTLDSIRHPVAENYEFKRFQHLQSVQNEELWGVWDYAKGEWRRPANYTRKEAASMSRFLNRTEG